MRLEGSKDGRQNAKRLRWQMTPPEIALWLALRANDAGLRFRKQHAARDYVLDFYCAPAGSSSKSTGKRIRAGTDHCATPSATHG